MKDCVNDTLHELMREATRLTQAGRLKEAAGAIQRALNGKAAVAAPAPWHTNPDAGDASRATSTARNAWPSSPVLEGGVFKKDAQTPAASLPSGLRFGELQRGAPPIRDTEADGPGRVGLEAGQGEFTSGTHTHSAQTRRYKLYSPPGHSGRRLPLVVMLHGCTQDPDDFAAGTGMNERAREQGFFVLYPEQSQEANPSRCWNWFNDDHQRRDSGEPALLASMTRMVMARHGIDGGRVYVAGMSAGGAMAAIVSTRYPEIFAAAGVHSGVPCGAARDIAGALSVMKRGVAGPGRHAHANRGGTVPAAVRPQEPVPTIVFHGDQDRTVHPANGERVIAAVIDGAAAARAAESPVSTQDRPQVEQGTALAGRRYTRSVHRDRQGKIKAEHWIVHGSGHAWSGGDSKGSYTDSKGPDATREMLRFFFSVTPHG